MNEKQNTSGLSGEVKTIDQREALKETFLRLCAQYDALGEQLKTVSQLISPYLNGDQELQPEIKFAVTTNNPDSTLKQ